MKIVFSESLAQAESNEVQNAKMVRFSFFTISVVRKTYFFELVLDGLSDFHQNGLRSSTDHAGKSFVEFKSIRSGILEKHINKFAEKHAKMDRRLISVTVWRMETKPGVCYNKHDLRLLAVF